MTDDLDALEEISGLFEERVDRRGAHARRLRRKYFRPGLKEPQTLKQLQDRLIKRVRVTLSKGVEK